MKRSIIVLILIMAVANVLPKVDFRLGLENIPETFLQKLNSCAAPCRIGLITNQTGKDQQGKRNIDLLLQRGLDIAYIFVPEHGLEGVVSAGRAVGNRVDKVTKIPVVSLYKKNTGKKIDPTIIKKIDVLFFDIQDSGMRHYTYISTLLHAIKSAAEHDKHIVVLDRPNPLGIRMEGPLVERDLLSFISVASIPLRHGMTVGELAWYFNLHVLTSPAKLHVIKMKHYDRRRGLNGILPQPLSPNIKHVQSCYGYSFLGLLGEVGPFNVGVGTDMAFCCILLPNSIKFAKKRWRQLQQLLQLYGIASSWYSYANKKKKQRYSGLQLRIDDINSVTSFNLLLDVLHFFKHAGVPLSFSSSFNKAVGTKNFQKIFAGTHDHKLLLRTTQNQLCQFFKKAQQVFMYWPAPFIAGIKNK